MIFVDTICVKYDEAQAALMNGVGNDRGHDVQIYAHRGASQIHPENTLDAFAEAVRLGVDGIELDLHTTSDGIPVVSHDASLTRALGIDSDVRQVTFAELRSLAPAVPTLTEVLDLVGPALHFDLEVKQAGIESHLLPVLRDHPDARWAISCFDWAVLEQFRSVDESIDLWLLGHALTDDLKSTAARLGATTAALFAPAISEATVASAHAAGLKVMAWTVNDPERARQLEVWGLVMLCTDAPHLFAS
jgi:glycerophosphoryl diester phosphodiesterase